MDPKVSPVTGKVVQFIVEVLGHLKFNNVYFMSLESEQFDVVSIRNSLGIQGWMREKKELVAQIKRAINDVYFKPICCPFIVKKEGNIFEYRQKGSVLIPINSEQNALFVMAALQKEGIQYQVFDDFTLF